MESNFPGHISPNQNLSSGKKEKREKYRSHITLFGRSRIWGFFCQKEIAGRRTDEAKSNEFYWKSGENKEEHLGWSPHKPPHWITR